MIKKLKCNKLLNFSSITVGSLINTFCSEDSIVLNNNSYITVNGYTTSLKGFKLKKNNEEIKDAENLTKYFMDIFSTFKFNNVENSEDPYNNKSLDEVFNFKENFKNKNLLIVNINDLFDKIKPNNKENIKKILENVFTNSELRLYLKTYQRVSIRNNSSYRLKKEFREKLEKVNNEIKIFFNVGQIKDLMQRKGFERAKISIIYDNGNKVEDDTILSNNTIWVNYNDDILDPLDPKTAEIEFIAGDGLVLAENVKKHEINFAKDKINKDTTIFNFITNKFKGLSDKNCKIEYFDSGDDTWYDAKEGDRFVDEDKIKITINTEVKDYTIKKNTQNPPKNENQQNQEESDTESGNEKGGCCKKCCGSNKNK